MQYEDIEVRASDFFNALDLDTSLVERGTDDLVEEVDGE